MFIGFFVPFVQSCFTLFLVTVLKLAAQIKLKYDVLSRKQLAITDYVKNLEWSH